MADVPDTDLLRSSLSVLSRAGIIPAAAEALRARHEATTRKLNATVLERVPAYSATADPDALPHLDAHLAEAVSDIRRLCSGRRPTAPDYVADYARWCADRKFPLEALLLVYRCTQQDLAGWLRDAALSVADDSAQLRRVVAAINEFVLRYTERQAGTAASEYVAHTRAIAEAEGDRRTKLMQLLLDGYDEADPQAATLLRRSGYLEQRRSYCVVLAQPVDAAEMQSAARARRLVDAMRGVLDNLGVRSLIAAHGAEAVAVVSITRRLSGWTPQQSSLAERLYEPLRRLGNAVLTGVSSDAPSTAHIPAARREASLALELATLANRVCLYSRVPLRDMMLHGARERLHASLPVWVKRLTEADERARGSLAATLRAYADASMNAQQAAIKLGVHPNTMYVRIQKIKDITGLDALNYHDLTELLLAADCR